jgi:hypothetical protein
MKTTTPQNPKEEKIQVIDSSAIVSMEISAGFQSRMVALTEFIVNQNAMKEGQLDAEIINNAHQEIQNQKISTPWVQHYETCLIFVYEFEKLAKEKGFVRDATDKDLA